MARSRLDGSPARMRKSPLWHIRRQGDGCWGICTRRLKIATLAGQSTGGYEYIGHGYQMRQPTVANEYNRLGFGVVLWLGNISGEAADFILSAGRLAFMDLATQAATAHSYILRHRECN